MTAQELQTENAEPVNGGQDFMHKECLLRGTAGSVTHIRKECEYYGGHKDCHACEEGMTKREAARASLRAVRIKLWSSPN